MTALIDGKVIAQNLRNELKQEIDELKNKNRQSAGVSCGSSGKCSS
jgi:5,10-methylene-tetrahydrofolate dehydrogenase/methenyl tetrahydrofolate cyclohydrolase